MSVTASRNTVVGGALLAVFALASAALVAIAYLGSKDRIAQAEREKLLSSLNALVPPARYDNDLASDKVQLNFSSERKKVDNFVVYRARKNRQPVAAIFEVTAPDGYSGPIKMLVALNNAGETIGVRVVSHKETPGLGDYIEEKRSTWIHGFDDKSLENPSPVRWRVKKDGGEFDQVTGATVTPRAVVKMVKRTLEYFAEHKRTVFDQETESRSP